MRVVTTIFLIIVLISGCKIAELTPEEKQKIAELQQEIAKYESEISELSALSIQKTTGLIPTLQQARLEVDRLTLSILKQQKVAIETGAKISAEVTTFFPDSGLVANLEREYEKVKNDYLQAKAESNLYSGGLLKLTAESKALVSALTLAGIKQKLLTAKYGLPLVKFETQKNDIAQQENKSVAVDNKEHVSTEPDIVDDGPFDFRNIRWGMSIDDVLKREKSTLREKTNDVLLYNEEIANAKAALLYSFIDGKLYSATYILDGDQFSNKNNYVDSYNKLLVMLKEKYGKPTDEKTYWSKDLYKNDYSERGMAYSAGHVVSRATWKREKDEIAVGIFGNNYKISVLVSYTDNELDKIAKQKKQKDSNSKF